MDKLLIAWIWNNADGGSGRLVGQIVLIDIIALVDSSIVAKLATSNLTLVWRWLFHFAFNSLY